MTTFSQLDASQIDPDLFFPDSDGKPMADNTEQFRWIVTIKENLEILFALQPDVFIAGDLLWYPIESMLITPTAPDVMVIFGRPKGKRGSYKQWKEDNIAPQVAFEILSPSNTKAEMARKREFYETYGVEEYYQFDPDRLQLKGWLREGDRLVEIPMMVGWVSPRLGIRFGMGEADMEIYRPNGLPFLTSIELDQRAEAAIAEAERQRLRATEAEAEVAEQRSQNVEQEVLLRQQEVQLRLIVQNLLRSGMAIEQVAEVTGMAIEDLGEV